MSKLVTFVFILSLVPCFACGSDKKQCSTRIASVAAVEAINSKSGNGPYYMDRVGALSREPLPTQSERQVVTPGVPVDDVTYSEAEERPGGAVVNGTEGERGDSDSDPKTSLPPENERASAEEQLASVEAKERADAERLERER